MAPRTGETADITYGFVDGETGPVSVVFFFCVGVACLRVAFESFLVVVRSRAMMIDVEITANG